MIAAKLGFRKFFLLFFSFFSNPSLYFPSKLPFPLSFLSRTIFCSLHFLSFFHLPLHCIPPHSFFSLHFFLLSFFVLPIPLLFFLLRILFYLLYLQLFFLFPFSFSFSASPILSSLLSFLFSPIPLLSSSSPLFQPLRQLFSLSLFTYSFFHSF